MADSERFRARGDETGDPAKRREELDHLLQRIAAHIAEVDKPTVTPPDALGESDIASGLAHEASFLDAEHAADAADDEAPQVGSNLEDEPGQEPPALRSAVAARGAAGGAHDRLPIHGAGASRHGLPPVSDEEAPQRSDSERGAWPHQIDRDEPWDQDAAEALTRSYEAEASVPPLRSMYNLMAQQGSSAGRADAMSSGEISHADVDAAQTRLFEAARRVEAMLDRLAPREAVEALGDRFDALEGEVRRSGDQLARLDGIETKLGELGQKLTDDQVLNLFGSLVPTADELSQFAEDAAGRAATRALEAYARDVAPRPVSQPDDTSSAMGGQLASLGDLLGRYMDERRRNDAGTLEALETLQLAMQHVLDRIDRTDAPAAAQNLAEIASVSHRDARLDAGNAAKSPVYEEHDPLLSANEAEAGLDEPSEGLVNLTARQVGGAPDLSAESYSMPENGLHGLPSPHGPEGIEETHAAIHQPADAVPLWARHSESADVPAIPAAREGIPTQASEIDAGEVQPSSDRQAFIAKARQAAERANAQSSQPARAKAEEAKAAKGRKRSVFAAEASRGIIRPGVLLVAIAAIVLASCWFLFVQKNGLLRPSASVDVGQPQTVASTTTQPQSIAAAPVETASALPPASQAPGEPQAAAAPDDRQQAVATAATGEAAGPGMAVSFSSAPSNVDAVMKARERSRIAGLSQRAAYSAARSYSVRDFDAPASHAAPVSHAAAPRAPSHADETSAIETSSVPNKAAATPAAPIGTGGHDIQQLSLPPATVGPLSLRIAAAKGDATAQVEVATRLAEGKGVRQDFAEATRWYGRAADQGNAVAQYRLATLYERGMGVKADRAKAQALYEKAAEQGNLKAMHNLAVITASPTSGAPDYATAARLFTRAAKHGLRDSQYNLGVLYESGLGVPKDHGAAYQWYALAAHSGDSVAARRRDSLIAKLPNETIQAMDAQIASWQPEPSNEVVNDTRGSAAARMQRSAQANQR
jgi:localization factor PodJL